MKNLLKTLFGFDPAQHKLKTEVAAGITTFLTMAYILAVNPSVFANLAGQGMDTNAVFTATALAAVFGTLIMAIYAKAVRPCPRHGSQRLLCLHGLHDNGLLVAVCLDRHSH